MKRSILASIGLVLCSLFCHAQLNLPAVDKSPMDMCYFPVNYPQLKVQDKATETPVARVIYSRPNREGRTIFGSLVEYGRLWRMGANEATELEIYKPVTIGGKKIPKGRYTLYAIPNEKTWTFILNKDTDTWGSFKYNPARDIVRVDVPAHRMETSTETLTMTFEQQNGIINLWVAWDTVKAALPIIQ